MRNFIIISHLIHLGWILIENMTHKVFNPGRIRMIRILEKKIRTDLSFLRRKIAKFRLILKDYNGRYKNLFPPVDVDVRKDNI